MTLPQPGRKPLLPPSLVLAAVLLSACGGGGSDSTSRSTDTPTGDRPATGGETETDPGGVPDTAKMTMSCVDGPAFQCSGGEIIQRDNGIALTSSGVQAYGKSTSDLAADNPEKTTAYGFASASGGMAEIRLAKDGNGAVSQPRVLLSNLGISWNGTAERPPIIETFSTSQARVHLDANGAVLFGPLPPSSDLGYYDFADKGIDATQANYGNNVYFPRGQDNPPRCTSCSNFETTGPQSRNGDWRTGGEVPDTTNAVRLHGDGDIHAGDGKPDANGNPTILPGGNGIGVPFPGSKGYRSLDNWSYKYGNLAAWLTQDTVSIVEWAPGSDEHSKMRRGVVAFGDVTAPADVPANGTASYSGVAYGWYASDGRKTESPAFFYSDVTVTVDFVTRETKVSLQRAVEYIDTLPRLSAVDFHTATKMGAAGINAANYFTGPLANAAMTGGISGRYFGPVTAGGSGAAPAEVGGAFSMANPTTGAVVVGGYIAVKR